MVSGMVSCVLAVVMNQFVVKKVASQVGFCMIWLAWTILGEAITSYWRLKMRYCDLSKMDVHLVPILSICMAVTINCGKRIPLLCLTDYTYIVVMNAACLTFEVFQRLTVVGRDIWLDQKYFRMSGEDSKAWMDVLHRQTYLHNEMLMEMMELMFPVPLSIVLYMIQYSPEGKAVLLAPILTNCILQILQELVADCICLWVGSTRQNKFYRAAKTSLFTKQSYMMLVFLIPAVCFGANGFYFYTYLRVGLTPDGDYVTLI